MQVFLPVIADMQTEWMQAHIESRVWKSHWVRIRKYWNLAKAMGLYPAVRLGKMLFAMWKAG